MVYNIKRLVFLMCWSKSKLDGKIKFFNEKKGFGFISGDDGTDYFFHFSALKDGVIVRDGDSVTFEVVEGDRGLKAENVDLA